MCVHSFAISWQTASAAALREETRLLLGATGRFLIPELMQPPAARAPGHSSSHNVCVSSDLPTTTWFSHSSERRRLTISLTNERARCVRGQAHSLFAPFFFLLSLSAIFSHLVGKYFLLPAHFFPPLHVKGMKPVVSHVTFSRCFAAGVASSGLWLAGDYYLKTWKSDRH